MLRLPFAGLSSGKPSGPLVLWDSPKRVTSHDVSDSPLLLVGDSHACFFAGERPRRTVQQEDGTAVIWLGPRLMHSVAMKGFGFSLRQRLLLHRSRGAVVVAILGEIDVRMYLGLRPFQKYRSDAWVKDYCERVLALGEHLRSRRIIVVSPVPPSDRGLDNPEFPRRGSLAARLDGHRWLCLSLEERCRRQGDRGATFLNLTSVLSDSSGQLKTELSDDGVHVNFLGAHLTRESIRKAAGI